MIYSRGVERSDGLATRGDEFVVDEEAGGLPVAVPIRGDKLHEEIGHGFFSEGKNAYTVTLIIMLICLVVEYIWRGSLSAPRLVCAPFQEGDPANPN